MALVSELEDDAEGDGPIIGDDWFSKAVYQLNRAFYIVAGVVLVAMMFLTVVDIIGRKFLGHPVPGSIEMTEIGLVIVIYFGFGFAQLHGEHITIDLLYEHLPKRAAEAMTVFAGILSVAIVGILTWRLLDYTLTLSKGGYETATWHVPLSIVGALAVLGAAAFTLAIIVTVLGEIVARHKKAVLNES